MTHYLKPNSLLSYSPLLDMELANPIVKKRFMIIIREQYQI